MSDESKRCMETANDITADGVAVMGVGFRTNRQREQFESKISSALAEAHASGVREGLERAAQRCEDEAAALDDRRLFVAALASRSLAFWIRALKSPDDPDGEVKP